MRPFLAGQAFGAGALTLHRALRRMAGLVFLLVFWVLAGKAPDVDFFTWLPMVGLISAKFGCSSVSLMQA